jgi:hypothetical protein
LPERDPPDKPRPWHNPSGLDLQPKLLCSGAYYRLGLLRIMRAAITPGTHPQSVKIQTIIKEPQPLSTTAKGGNNNESKTRQKLIPQKYGIFSIPLHHPNRE